jgi:SAM-dependent methyltransferase
VPIGEARILDIGSGYGDNLLQLLLWGANAWNLVGNDLLADRQDYSHTNLAAATMLVAGDARTLDLEPGSFDIVMASTVFSSIFDLEFWAEVRAAFVVLGQAGRRHFLL